MEAIKKKMQAMKLDKDNAIQNHSYNTRIPTP